MNEKKVKALRRKNKTASSRMVKDATERRRGITGLYR